MIARERNSKDDALPFSAAYLMRDAYFAFKSTTTKR